MPGPHLDPASLLDAFESRAGHAHRRRADDLDGRPAGARREPGRLRSLGDADDDRRRLRAAAGDDRGVRASATASISSTAWGMTEMAPLGTISGTAGHERGARRGDRRTTSARKQGPPIAVRRDPRARRGGARAVGRRDDGRARGARPVDRVVATTTRPSRPTASRTTAGSGRATSSRSTPTGTSRCRTGRRISIKSGGEWISIGRARERADGASRGRRGGGDRGARREVGRSGRSRSSSLREDASASGDELREFLAPQFAKFWLPDRFEFVDEIPKTAVGKFRKTALRERVLVRCRGRETLRNPA